MLRFPVPSRSARGRIAAVTLAALTAAGPMVAGFAEPPNLAQLIGMTSALLLAGLVAARPAAPVPALVNKKSSKNNPWT